MKKFLQNIKEFFKRLISGNDDSISSKRFTMLYGMLVLLAVIILIAVGIVIPEYVFWGLTSLILAGAGLSVVEKFRRKKDNDIFLG